MTVTVTSRPLLLASWLSVVVAACGALAATPQAPSATTTTGTSAPAAPSPGADAPWLQADITLPSAVTSAPTLLPGYQCHPCHFLAENDLIGAGALGEGLIAVGIEQPPAHAVAFSSADGIHWTQIEGFPGPEGSAAVAVASASSRTIVVGHDADGATSWVSDGARWTKAPSQADLLVPYAAGSMTSVASLGDGFVAGGYHDDPLHATASAAVWRSIDGLTWRADDAPASFRGGRILGIAARDGVIVAVGTSGDPNYGPAAAWRWTRDDGWRPATIAPDGTGAMRAVTATGAGFVAVGLNGDDDGARTWTSPDGITWTAALDQDAFHFYTMAVRMQAVISGPRGLVAAGWRSDPAKGSGVTWSSTDGITWVGPTWEPSFSGGQITGLAALEGSVVAVGRTGYPDWNQATIWVEQAP